MAELIAFEGVSAGYGSAVVLDDVSFALEPQGSLALLGRNGVGKTTLLVTLMGLTRVHRGRLSWEGRDLAAMPTYRRAQAGLGWVPQERFVFPSLTVEEHLRVVARPGHWTERRIYTMFPRLEERRANFGNQLSGGEQQMLAIARALLSRPALLLLDEPSLGLAPRVTRELFAVLGQVKAEQGTSMLLVEQNATLALELADTAYVLEAGRTVLSGSAADVRADESVRRAYLGY